MCLGIPILGKTEGRVIELRFQARIHGHHTDDLVCVHEDDAGECSRVLMQIKRTLKPTVSDAAFYDAIGCAWADFQSAELFTRGVDSIFVIYDEVSAGPMSAAAEITDWARWTASSAEFLAKVTAPKFSSGQKRNALGAIRQIANREAGREISDDEAYQFLKHLYFYSQALDREGTQEQINYLHQIRDAARAAQQQVEPVQVWSRLVNRCAELNTNAATVTLTNLSDVLGSGLNFILTLPAENVSLAE